MNRPSQWDYIIAEENARFYYYRMIKRGRKPEFAKKVIERAYSGFLGDGEKLSEHFWKWVLMNPE